MRKKCQIETNCVLCGTFCTLQILRKTLLLYAHFPQIPRFSSCFLGFMHCKKGYFLHPHSAFSNASEPERMKHIFSEDQKRFLVYNVSAKSLTYKMGYNLLIRLTYLKKKSEVRNKNVRKKITGGLSNNRIFDWILAHINKKWVISRSE